MHRRNFLKSIVGSAAAASCSLLSGCGQTKTDRIEASCLSPRPNVLLILMDDLGWGDLGCFGHPVIKTPHIDALAKRGCRLTDFYVPMPLCSPTRAACLTGRDPNRYGMQHVINMGLVNPHVTVPEVHHLPVEEPTLPRQLQKIGYRTGTIGKWHLSLNWYDSEPQPADYGFDYSFISGGSQSLYHGPSVWSRNSENVSIGADQWYPDLYVDEAIAFIEESKDNPFYLNLWPFTPHVREEAATPYQDMYAGCTEQEKVYYGCITQMDEQLGRLFAHLDKRGLTDHTIIIFTSDNGAEPPVNEYRHTEARRGSSGGFRGSKHLIYEGGIRVPAIIVWPGLTESGSISSVPVSVLDLFPTLCNAAGGILPSNWAFDGGDFRPALKGLAVQRSHSLYFQCDYSMNTFMGPDYNSPPLALRKDNWKLMCDLNFENPRLYNLDFDRSEQFNLDREYPERVETMLAELKTIYRDINGPYQKQARILNPELLKNKSNP